MYFNEDRSLADDPTQWDTKNFDSYISKQIGQPSSYEDWRQKRQALSYGVHTTSLAGTPTIVVVTVDDPTTTTAPEICTKIVSNKKDISNIPAIHKEILSNKDVSSNLSVVATHFLIMT